MGWFNRQSTFSCRQQLISFFKTIPPRQTIPVLNSDITSEIKSEDKYAKELIEACRKFIKPLFPLAPKEVEFIRLLREEGSIKPELLADDKELADKIRLDPALVWRATKAKN